VVFLPLSVALLVVLDLYAGFSTAEWVAVAALVIVHLVFSVPAFPGAIYYMGSHLVRPDHVVHLFAGGLVAWLCWDVLWRRLQPPKVSPKSLAVIAVLMALGFGALKETTDFLSVRASGLITTGSTRWRTSLPTRSVGPSRSCGVQSAPETHFGTRP